MFRVTTEKCVKICLLVHNNSVSKCYNAETVKRFSLLNRRYRKTDLKALLGYDNQSVNRLTDLHKNHTNDLFLFRFQEIRQKMLSLKELFEECGLDKFNCGNECQKESMIHMKIDKLVELGLIKDYKELFKRMASYLETFPFDENIEDLPYYNKESKDESIASIRDYIEAKYLSKKLNANYYAIIIIRKVLKPCVYEGRSLRSTIYKLNLINHFKSTLKLNIKQKIFLINTIPFEINYIPVFKAKVLGVDWYILTKSFPYFMKNSYISVKFFFNILKKEGYTNFQILEAISVLRVQISTVLKRLPYLASLKSSNFHKDRNFLKLLFFSEIFLSKLYLTPETYQNLVKIVDLESNVHLKKKNYKQLKEICNSLGGTEYHFDILLSHSKRQLVNEIEIYDSILFLVENEYTFDEILDCITIILYSRDSIRNSLQYVSQQKNCLVESGFNDGCSSSNTSFNRSSKLRRKILQLCLYYIEQEYNFDGNEVLLSSS